jgi:TPR repeat protein
MLNLGCRLDRGEGVAAPDHPAAADWYRRAADAGSGEAAYNLLSMYTVGRGGA